MSTEAVVGTAEMARLLGISTDTLRSMARSGQVPYLELGRKLGFIPSEVIASRRRDVSALQRIGVSERSRNARRKVF